MQTWTSVIELSPWAVGLPTVVLFAISILPTKWANHDASAVGRFFASLSLLQLAAATCVAVSWLAVGRPSLNLAWLPVIHIPLLQEFTFQLDGPTVLMFG